MEFDFDWLFKEATIEDNARTRRNRVWILSEQQNHRCCYCGIVTWFYDGNGEYKYPFELDRLPYHTIRQKATAEHVVPLSKGGEDTIENMVMACDRCNNARGNKDAIAYFDALQAGGHNLTYFLKIHRKYTDKEKSEKKELKEQRTIFFLGCLFFMSPVAKAMGDAILAEIEAKAHEQA